MKAVSNTTPIISLASINRLDILSALFGKVIISETVYSELKAKEGPGYAEADADFIIVMSLELNDPEHPILEQLDRGEAETIFLSKEIDADLVLIDESIGYQITVDSGLNVVRTLSVLLKAKEKGIIPKIKPLLDEMIQNGRWYSRLVYQNFLHRIGEL